MLVAATLFSFAVFDQPKKPLMDSMNFYGTELFSVKQGRLYGAEY